MAVADWTERHSEILIRVVQAQIEFVASVLSAADNPGRRAFDRLHEAGRALALVSERALAIPATGVALVSP